MKSKLYLKVFSGPLLGAIKSGTQHITGDIPEAIIHILAILKKSRFNADYSKLRLKVRTANISCGGVGLVVGIRSRPCAALSSLRLQLQ